MEEFLQHKTPYRAAYIHGPPGSGKSTFGRTALRENDFDVVEYTATEERSKTIVDFIAEQSSTCNNVLRMFSGHASKTAIFIDDIDCIHDKLSSLIKLIKPCKGRFVPIVLVGNTCNDKKMKDLIKACFTVCIPPPSATFMRTLVAQHPFADMIVAGSNNNLRKLFYLSKVITTKEHADAIVKSHVVDTSKTFTAKLFNTLSEFSDHHILNDNDRTIVAMLWHENVIDHVNDPVTYRTILSNMCFADYIDRVTFQRQIWQFNRLSSLVKTFYNNLLLHRHTVPKPREVRFTKILTKYSTEYNNLVFIQRICRTLLIDFNSLMLLINSKRAMHPSAILAGMKTDAITLTDVNRLLRFV